MLTTPNAAPGNAQIWDAAGGAEDKKVNSLYVNVFQNMLEIVLKREKFLFSEAERACLERQKALSYPARYLLVRLCLCKRGKWHTLGALGRYAAEIGGKQHAADAIDELCGIVRAPPAVKKEEEDVIDLTMDEEGEGVAKEENAAASSSSAAPEEEDEYAAFASDDSLASLPELLACLSMDDLKLVGKQVKVTKAGQTRPVLIDAILSNASTQSTLAFPVLTPRKNSASGAGMRQLTLNFGGDGKKRTQAAVVRRLVGQVMGRCVRIAPAVFRLFDRLNLVFFRSTTYSTSLLLPALLSAFHKRQYSHTEYTRSATIFRSRQALLDYEDALALEARVDEAFGGAAVPRKVVKGKGKEAAPPKASSKAEAVRVVWERVYERWKALVACKEEEGVGGLERFECGHVLTRIVYKGAQALSILKEYDLEMEVLQALLAQTRWRRGRRGAWYDRLALVLMTHCEKTPEILEAALNVVIQGLEDEMTHLIYRPRLERRLTRLEKMLKIPMNERHKCDGKLKKAQEVFVEGVRVPSRAQSVVLDTSGRVKSVADSPFAGRSKSEAPFAVVRSSTQPPERAGEGEGKSGSSTGKTRWIGKQGEEVSVEQLALEYYEDEGYKGFHSEGSIVSTIFGLLFWDIIFAPVPGAFETPYQSAPLDIHEDSFYSARKDLIVARLSELEQGRARDILERVDDKERPNGTWCIGVQWEFERGDLLEIVDCIGGRALAIICQMICEDYGQWRGGVPDLFVWKAATQECKFVEVKSPNDTLQENQKVWIDVLIGSQTSVDLCHVTEKGAKKKAKKSSTRKKRKATVASSDVESEELEVELESEEEDFDQLDQSQGAELEESEAKNGSPTPMKRRKMEVEVFITPRKRRKGV